MTTKEASWVSKRAAAGIKQKMILDGNECVSVTDSDFKQKFAYSSENGFENPYKGIYIWYDNSQSAIYSMCVLEEKSGTIYQANIERLELVKDEK